MAHSIVPTSIFKTQTTCSTFALTALQQFLKIYLNLNCSVYERKGLPTSGIGRESWKCYLNVLSTWLHTVVCGDTQTPRHCFHWLTFFLAKLSQEAENRSRVLYNVLGILRYSYVRVLVKEGTSVPFSWCFEFAVSY